MTLEDNLPLRQRHVTVGDIRLHVTEAGPEGGPPVVLLHGFPEFWYGWRHQIPALAAAGYRVIAPDQRGYNLSDKPPRVADYSIDRLAADVVALIDRLGYERIHLVGHDWGGGVAWWVAGGFAERIEKLVVLNCPHGDVFLKHLLRNPRQTLRSWYVFWFQLPGLPEWTLTWRDGRFLSRALQKEAGLNAFADEDLRRYREAWSQPGAMRAMINWYRALMRFRPQTKRTTRIEVPTLLIWGTGDRALGREMAPESIAVCDDGRLELIETAGHFVQHEAPQRVNELLLDFLKTRPEERA